MDSFDSHRRDAILCEALLKWYAEDSSRTTQLLDILDNKDLTLRQLDAFVTGYAKQHRHISLASGVGVYASYRSCIKSYSKRLFDIFPRAPDKVQLPFPGGEVRESTAGQLNFCRWLITNGIVALAEEHASAMAGAGVKIAATSSAPRAGALCHNNGVKPKKRPRRGGVGLSVRVRLTFN